MPTKQRVVDALHVSLYPVDMSSFLMPMHCTLDTAGVPCHMNPLGYHPTIVVQYALAHLNAYLETSDKQHCDAFLTQAYWLVEHEERISNDAGGWPISFPLPDLDVRVPYLSALAQGGAVSVLVRAYQLTRKEVFLEVICRAVRTFERDILDGGINTPVGVEGVFFEEVAVYPARHTLSGFIFALLGLYDYVALTGAARIEKLINRSHMTMHTLLEEYDTGFWIRTDLIHRRLASPSHLALNIMLLEALANYAQCDCCQVVALRCQRYQRQVNSRVRYLISSHYARSREALWRPLRALLFHRRRDPRFLRVCIPVTAFPVTGGMRTVLTRVAQVTADVWRQEYLTQHIGPQPGGFVIHRFGTARMTPSQFPNVWFYVLAGFCKLVSLLRRGAGYDVILPQDGIFTAAFVALAARLAGVRVVCIDHGNISLLRSRVYRAERIRLLATMSWWRALLARLRYMCYWPSLHLLAKIAAHFVDHYLVPGVAGDGIEEAFSHLGVHQSSVTRFANMIDMKRHVLLDARSRAHAREKIGIAADAIVIIMVCRLAPEKGFDIALASISHALSKLSPDLCARVRVIIVGDGPLRKAIEEDIQVRGLQQTCFLWGEAPPAEVISLLSLSDIFLYTSRRGVGYPLAILEAMASNCAVVASSEPLANVHLLAEGRGIAVPVADTMQTSEALLRLVNDLELCHHMGQLARNYVGTDHSPAMFRRTLMRAIHWSALSEVLDAKQESEASETGSES